MKILNLNFTRVASGLSGSEGPVFNTNGKFYAVAPMEMPPSDRPKDTFIDNIGGKVYCVNVDTGEIQVICTPHFDGYGGRPAGCQCDREGNIWVADMRLGLLKISNGECIQVSKVDSDGNPLRGANDLVFDDDGNLWFTGPGSIIAPEPEDRNVLFSEPVGVIYCLPRGETVPIKADGNLFFPNGIAVRGRLLLVALTASRQLVAYDIEAAGRVSNRRIWANVPKEREGLGGPDGMDFDAKGQLLVANHGGSHIEVYAPDGGKDPVARIKCPFDKPSNVHFKPGTNICYVTEHDNDAVWRFEWESEGMPMYCDKR